MLQGSVNRQSDEFNVAGVNYFVSLFRLAALKRQESNYEAPQEAKMTGVAAHRGRDIRRTMVRVQDQERAGTEPGSEILATCSAIGSVESGCIWAE